MTRRLRVGLSFLTVFGVLGISSILLEKRAGGKPTGVQAPLFEVEPLWPKPLPNHWVVGWTIGVSVDARDHIWLLHRASGLEPTEVNGSTNPPSASCCVPAPPVLEFDEAGNLIGHWGGPGEGYNWPEANHGITVDYKGNVWIGGNGRGTAPGQKPGGPRGEGAPIYYNDSMVLKFSQQGKLIMQIGKPGGSQGSSDTQNLGLPAKVFVDPKTNEAYVADGYGNRRVIVFDAETGKYKRHWGAYGHQPDDTNLGKYDPSAPPAQQFRNPVHCAELSHDGLLYVCDRVNDRIQVFKPDGTFVKEVFVAKNTLGEGAVFDIAFSSDPQQKYLYIADGSNNKVYVMLRDSLEILTSFGDGGRQPGQFYAVHSIATDSKGNIFTTETHRGQRLQKFNYKGVSAVTKQDQGTVWPKGK